MNEPDISPLARRLAEENNVNWQSLAGTGADGKVVERDVLEYLARVMTGDAALDPTPEPLPEGLEEWPDQDVAGYQPNGVNLDQLQAELSAAPPSFNEPTPGSTLDAPPPADLISDGSSAFGGTQNSDAGDSSSAPLELAQDDDDDLLEIDDIDTDAAPPMDVSGPEGEEEAISEDIFLFDDGEDQAVRDAGQTSPVAYQQEALHPDPEMAYGELHSPDVDPDGVALDMPEMDAGLGESLESSPPQESEGISIDAFEEEVQAPSMVGSLESHEQVAVGSPDIFEEAVGDAGGDMFEGVSMDHDHEWAEPEQVPEVFADDIDALSSDLSPELFVSDEESPTLGASVDEDPAPDLDFQETEADALFGAAEDEVDEAVQHDFAADESSQGDRGAVDSFEPEAPVGENAGTETDPVDEETNVQVSADLPAGAEEPSSGELEEEPSGAEVANDRSVWSLEDVGSNAMEGSTDQSGLEGIPLVSYGMLLRRHLDLTSLAEAQLAVSRELSEEDPISPTPFLVRAVAKAMEVVQLGESPPELALAVITSGGFGTKMISEATSISFRSLLSETRDAVGSDTMNGATLVVADMSALEVDEAVLNLGVPVLTLGRILFDNQQGRYHSTLSLSGSALPPEEGAKLLAYVAELLTAPVQLVL